MILREYLLIYILIYGAIIIQELIVNCRIRLHTRQRIFTATWPIAKENLFQLNTEKSEHEK